MTTKRSESPNAVYQREVLKARYREIEDEMAQQIHYANPAMPQPHRQYRFHETRRWLFDFAWPGVRVALECDGQTWTLGGHTSGVGYQRDREKDAEAMIRGWLVLHVTRAMVNDGSALTYIRQILEMRRKQMARMF